MTFTLEGTTSRTAWLGGRVLARAGMLTFFSAQNQIVLPRYTFNSENLARAKIQFAENCFN